MISRSTWITLAIFLFALGALWYLEWSPAKEARLTPTPTSLPKLLGNIAPNNVTRLELVSTKGENVALQRNPDKTWGFVNQPGKLVDQGQAEYLTSSLFGMNIKSSMGDTINLNSIGLDSATLTIKIITTNGSADLLHVGKINPVKNGYFVRVNDQLPVLIDNNALDEVMGLFSLNSLIMTTPTPSPTIEVKATGTAQPAAVPTVVETKIQ